MFAPQQLAGHLDFSAYFIFESMSAAFSMPKRTPTTTDLDWTRSRQSVLGLIVRHRMPRKAQISLMVVVT